ncbi:hypothetical protein RHGRI_007390 [Rhododendron griersonianum]|uniref:F-box domain-containing protein n=1 Tax=Rhododendron griersonianum TaxID=479676 RepID=A0AAV6KWT0_9ERIC|nr:hypothetical protein RHGRI_007390 [Rhododendron griersonianum]
MAMSTEFTKLFPNLPEELALECLTRLNYVARRVGALVCRRWRELLLNKDFFYHRNAPGSPKNLPLWSSQSRFIEKYQFTSRATSFSNILPG